MTKPHFVLVPLMAPGHMIPMIDMARLLATHGATVTLVTTPANSARVGPTIDKVKHTGLPVNFVSLRFPTTEVGLPDGYENMDMLSNNDQFKNFLDAMCMLRDPLILHLRSHEPLPTCIVSDLINYWTQDVAREFNIPRFMFHGYGCFPLLCLRGIRSCKEIEETTKDENEPFAVPGLPITVVITQAQLRSFLKLPTVVEHVKQIREAELAADGVVVNTFDGLEMLYCELYQNTIGKKVWTIGPLSDFDRDVGDVAARGDKTSVDKDQSLRWLDSMKPSSVLYVSFGSLARPSPAQHIEIGLGLEALGCPFIWVIKGGEKSPEVEEWLTEFEKRMSAKGIIIRGWASQAMILSHPAVGGFMTHCGWNSMLESVSASIPMITWPNFGDQFPNEKLIVEILRIGVPIGVEVAVSWGVEKQDVLVNKDEVEKALGSLFDEGEEAEERRKRARDLAEKAQEVICGGSSYSNLMNLIQHMIANKFTEGKAIA